MKNTILTFFLISLFFVSANAQNKKALEDFGKATQYYNEHNFEKATEWFKKATEKDSTFTEAFFKLGQQYEIKREIAKTLENYNKVISLDSLNTKYLQAYNYVGSRALEANNLLKAKELLSFSKDHTNPKSVIYKQLSRQIAICDFRLNASKNSYKIQPHLLSKQLNAHLKSYFPVLTVDNKNLYYTVEEKNGDENIYLSKFENNTWSKGVPFVLNSNLNEGTCTISADGRIMVFTACNRPDGFGLCDLYISKKNGESWSKPQNLGTNINTRYWESQPSLSSDGRILYFSSNRPDGLGNYDIWMSVALENGEWLKPQNLGPKVNTPYNEVSPFFHQNGKTLFFASDGHLGMGGYDLFSTEKNKNEYSQPINLGFPINNEENQSGLIISSDNHFALYSTEENDSTKLYTFEIPQELATQHKKTNYLQGKIIDNESKKALKTAIEIIDLKTNESILKTQSDSLTGEYMAVLPNGSKYALYIDKKGYFLKSLSFDFSDNESAEGKHLDVNLDKIKKDVRGVLANLFFDSGKWELKEDSFNELDKVSKLLTENPTLRVEISGHTDDIGKNEDNLLLSQKRAQSVVDYLVQHGVNTTNIKAVGYGETKPISPNDSDTNRQTNRRIEMLIL